MVQKKLSKILSLQTDHIKNENQLQDLKTKKMKKSGSIKRPELDTTLISIRQPAKPPPPPPRTTPNYMKPTTSSDARKPQTSPDSSSLRRRISSTSAGGGGGSKPSKTAARALTKNPSFKPPRKFSSDSKRATCSSTLKDCKFPAFLGLNNGGTESEGTSKIKVCPYTYCSLNGHHHRPPLPPLKCFLSARRRVMNKNKNQRSVKLTTMQDDGLKNSLVSSPLVVEEEQNQDFFVEIYCEDRVEDEEGKSGIFVSDFELGYDCDYEYCSGEEEVENQLIDGDLVIKADDEKGGPLDEFLIDQVSQESLDEDSLSSDALNERGRPLDELLMDQASQESLDEDSLNSDAFSTSDEDVESSDSSSYDATSNQEEDYCIVENEAPLDNPIQIELCYEDPSKEPLSEVALVVLKCTESDIQTAETAADRTGGKCKKNPVEETDDELGIFDPRGPNFLELEPGPEGEKVDLRHQDLDERKNSEEWMVDFALRQVVTKLGPARKKKVSLLVEAFEKVMPINKFDRRLRHASGFDQARQIQACN
ncbi:hypothetical protein MIMGU_mgv1a004280mg [Erythranthe guttata]|uniref:Calmodulin-binding domain-containing protein n=1 Tax=Erythranthe guttata TaxID=4155 RepID=A0A022RTD7_ERYGU|nr:PREDICTED: uncharacterized protein LOC105951806 [Erythranthe guttata]EYU42968.1 hypothetical protein MIMGU_mgv1a004280mg [Erythranthe guttata]|eukprot:XP_012830713.1 PREDICTED: uncharacterized protein LOC105951806 [Erythranthe guttata]